VLVHAAGEATLALFHGRVGGHGDDGQCLEASVGSEPGGRLVAVHFRHLEIHQHQVERGWLRSAGQDLNGFASVVRYLHRGPLTFKQLGSDLLVDLVILGQKDPRAAQSGRRGAFGGDTGLTILVGEHIYEGIHDHGFSYRFDEESVEIQAFGFFPDFFASERGDEDNVRRVS